MLSSRHTRPSGWFPVSPAVLTDWFSGEEAENVETFLSSSSETTPLLLLSLTGGTRQMFVGRVEAAD